MSSAAAESVQHTRPNKGVDQRLEHKVEFQKHIKARMGMPVSLDCDLMLYDVTSTYFEGECSGNRQAQRRYGRDSRPDCKQVCIGLVVSCEGYPLGYQVFDGSTVDMTTVDDTVEEMEELYGQAGRV